MSEDRIETTVDEVESSAEDLQDEELSETQDEQTAEARGCGSPQEGEGAGDYDAPEDEESEEDEEYETVEIEYSEDDIEAYIVDEDDNEIGFILLDEDGNEVEYYYDDDEEADAGEPGEDNPYDLGITREGVAEATSDMNDIYRDGVAIAVDLKDALSEIKEALDFSDILPTKKK